MRGKSLTPLQRRAHADKRYFTWSAKLTNSIQPRAVRFTQTEVIGQIVASESYAPLVEFGSEGETKLSNVVRFFTRRKRRTGRRAFPFMGPALIETKDAGFRVMAIAVARMFR